MFQISNTGRIHVNVLKRSVQSLTRRITRSKTQPCHLQNIQDKFSAIHRENTWGSDESISGAGSTRRETEAIRTELPRLIEQTGAKSLLDIPCGDFNWMKDVDLRLDSYFGAEIVDEIVRSNRRQFANDWRQFATLDITKDPLPTADLILCRDCLVHFSFEDIFLALENIDRGNSKYLLTTTFPSIRTNRDILTGQWRPLNLQAPPLNFPEPIILINEQCPEKAYTDKSLGLWRLGDRG